MQHSEQIFKCHSNYLRKGREGNLPKGFRYHPLGKECCRWDGWHNSLYQTCLHLRILIQAQMQFFGSIAVSPVQIDTTQDVTT